MVSIIGNIEFEQNFKMTMISLFENFRIRLKFQNDHDILKVKKINLSSFSEEKIEAK